MSLVISKVFTYDTDAGDYIQRVEGASGDNQALEPATRQAINNFVIGCKQDGIWNAIKASCILSGARTLNGALQPLVGTAPTNNGPFVSGDYNRKTGLVGNGSSKYLNSNRAGNADPQNSFHASCFISSIQTGISGKALMGSLTTGPLNRMLQLAGDNGQDVCALRSDGTLPSTRPINSFASGFMGGNRPSSTTFNFRYSNTQLTKSEVSLTPAALNIFVFAQNLNNTLSAPTDARLAFYSIGESLDLALLDARVTALITAFGVAIP
jgi:hypothetical protein